MSSMGNDKEYKYVEQLEQGRKMLAGTKAVNSEYFLNTLFTASSILRFKEIYLPTKYSTHIWRPDRKCCRGTPETQSCHTTRTCSSSSLEARGRQS